MTKLPEIKIIRPINFVFHRAEITMNQLESQIPVAKSLFREVVRLDIHPTGPIHWHYAGFTGDAVTPFTLEVCLPVATVPPEYDGVFHFKRTAYFRAATLLHEGGWNDIPKSYAMVFQFISQYHYQPVGINRELYINADFSDPQSNVTEIQVGINE